MPDKLKPEFPSQGWKQILTGRKEMLDTYDRARDQAKAHEVETFHGKVAEGAFRKWLSGFLPKRYGVTSGYIVSPGLRSTDKLPHFDVIIYDQLESPILWIEDNPDSSAQGRSLALPVEYVRTVLEVKVAFSANTVRQGIEHLKDLTPLLQDIDDPSNPYKLYLPPTFTCGLVFFELRKPDAASKAALMAMTEAVGVRGFFGGTILRGEGHALQMTGNLAMFHSETPCDPFFFHHEHPLLYFGMSETVQVAEKVHVGAKLDWREADFARFAFRLVAFLQGTYRPGFISSFYGWGGTLAEEIPGGVTDT